MKLTLSLWVPAIAGFLAPAAVAGQPGGEMGWGKRQDLTPSSLTSLTRPDPVVVNVVVKGKT